MRLVPDIDLEELRCAAKTMAYKSGFIGFPMGGAKAAIRAVRVQDSSKDEMLRLLGKRLRLSSTRGLISRLST